MIHDRTSARFVPRAKLAAVMQVLMTMITTRISTNHRSRNRNCSTDPRIAKNSVAHYAGAYGITAAVEIDDDVEIIRPGPTRAYTFSQSMYAREIANYGRSNQEQLPEDRGPGYVWRIFTVTVWKSATAVSMWSSNS